MSGGDNIDLILLREALEASWDKKTSNMAVSEEGNPALGQCYPTARVVQYFFQDTEIVIGVVWNGEEDEIHFWNVLEIRNELYHIDLTWQQFPPGSIVKEFHILDRSSLGDGIDTIERCQLLKKRVVEFARKRSLAKS